MMKTSLEDKLNVN